MTYLQVDISTLLRSVRIDDASELYALIDANRAYLRQWLPWVDETTSKHHIANFILSVQKQETEGRGPVCCIVYRDSIVGICGFKPIDAMNRSAEIGYWLAESVTGLGIMTSCVRNLLEYAFIELAINRVELRAAKGNTRSRAVAERLNFIYEGDLREAEWLGTHYADLAVYSHLKSDWIQGRR